jgi:ArsR family transcriptional regulator
MPLCDCDVIHHEVVDQVRATMPDHADFYELANLYKLLSDTTRIKILWALHCRDMCVCDIAVLLDMKKSAVSHQLKSLRLARLVKFEKQGRMVYYSLMDDHVRNIFEKGVEHIHE